MNLHPQFSALSCCDFCGSDTERRAHTRALCAEYEQWTLEVAPREGWRVLRFGEDIPPHHQAFQKHIRRWVEHRSRSTMTPMWARRSGWDVLWAVPITQEAS